MMVSSDDSAVDVGASPGRPGQVIRLHPRTRERHMDWLTWGLLPHDTRHPGSSPRPIHARAETVAELPIFADAFRRRRALVPATEYYQRRTIGEPLQRYVITRGDGQPMGIAGLWESYVWPDKRIERTYCIITVEATGAVAEINDRMPLVLEQADWPLWLGEMAGDPTPLLRPRSDDMLVVRLVHRRKESDRRV
jgi:putative SOS response-associated peptidase YedK